MLRTAVAATRHAKTGPGWPCLYCAGQSVSRRCEVKGRPFRIQHSGGLRGFTATVCFDPHAQVGAIVLVNGTGGIAELGRDLASIARRLVLAAPPAIDAPEPTPAQYRPLLGIYTRPELGGWIVPRLEWRDGNLVFIAPEAAAWQLTLTPTGDPDVFVAGPESDLLGEYVTFQRLADGRVASALVMDSTFVRLERVSGSG